MYFNKKMGKSGGMPFKGNGTEKQSDVPRQYQLNISEPGIKSVGTLRGSSASAAPIVAVNKARYDNRQPSKHYEEKTSSQNLTYFLDFRDALKKVSGTDELNVNPTTSLTSLKPISKPVPIHSTPIHISMPLFIQACIDMNYGKDNSLYDNTSKTLKFSTPAHGKIQPERKELFGMLMDDLNRIEQGQFPVHEEWFDCFGTKMTPSKAHKLRSLLERISRLIGFMLENNTWLGKGSVHMRSIMNALLTKNLIEPKTYQKQKYYSFFYHLTEQSYDDNQGRAIRGEPKPRPLVNAEMKTIPFPATYIKDALFAQNQERDAIQLDAYLQMRRAAEMASMAVTETVATDVQFGSPNLENGSGNDNLQTPRTLIRNVMDQIVYNIVPGQQRTLNMFASPIVDVNDSTLNVPTLNQNSTDSRLSFYLPSNSIWSSRVRSRVGETPLPFSARQSPIENLNTPMSSRSNVTRMLRFDNEQSQMQVQSTPERLASAINTFMQGYERPINSRTGLRNVVHLGYDQFRSLLGNLYNAGNSQDRERLASTMHNYVSSYERIMNMSSNASIDDWSNARERHRLARLEMNRFINTDRIFASFTPRQRTALRLRPAL